MESIHECGTSLNNWHNKATLVQTELCSSKSLSTAQTGRDQPGQALSVVF